MLLDVVRELLGSHPGRTLHCSRSRFALFTESLADFLQVSVRCHDVVCVGFVTSMGVFRRSLFFGFLLTKEPCWRVLILETLGNDWGDQLSIALLDLVKVRLEMFNDIPIEPVAYMRVGDTASACQDVVIMEVVDRSAFHAIQYTKTWLCCLVF